MTDEIASVVLVTAAHPDNESVRVPLFVETVESMSVRPGFPYELTIVVNFASDGLRRAIDRLTDAHPEIQHVIWNRHNLAMTGGWRVGFAMAEGDYFVNITDDLWFGPNWLEELLAPFGSHGPLPERFITALYVGRSRSSCVGSLNINGREFRVITRAGAHCWGWRREDYLKHGPWIARHYGDTHMANKLTRAGFRWILPARERTSSLVRDTNIATDAAWDFENKRLVHGEKGSYKRPWNYKDRTDQLKAKRREILSLWSDKK